MKRMISIFVIMICTLAVATSAVLANAGYMGQCDMGGKHEKMHSRKGMDEAFFRKAHLILANASEIGLGDEQVTKIKTLKYSLKKSLIKEEADIKLLALDIRQELGKDEPDIAAVNSLIDKKYNVKAQKAKEIAEAYVNLKKILTKDQCAKIKTICCSNFGKKDRHQDLGRGAEGAMGRGPSEE